MLGLKLNHVSKGGPKCLRIMINIDQLDLVVLQHIMAYDTTCRSGLWAEYDFTWPGNVFDDICKLEYSSMYKQSMFPAFADTYTTVYDAFYAKCISLMQIHVVPVDSQTTNIRTVLICSFSHQ